MHPTASQKASTCQALWQFSSQVLQRHDLSFGLFMLRRVLLMLCRHRHVALHSQQPISRHSSHCAATVANNSFHGGFVLRKHHKLCIIYSRHQRRITIIYLSLIETLVFAYLGLAIFSFHHNAEPSLIIWSIVSCRKKCHTKL